MTLPGTPVNEELGHGYQQLIRCLNAFVLTKDDEGKPIHGDWQNLTMTAEFQEFRIIGFTLYTMTHAHHDTCPGMLPRC
jgi:hypothetical protein